MSKPTEITELDEANKVRLRAEVIVIAGRLRRALIAEYKEQWDDSLANGRPLKLSAGAAEIDRIALDAALKTFGGTHLLTGGSNG